MLTSNDGALITGQVSGESVISTSNTVEAQNAGSCLSSLVRTASANTTDECAFVHFAKNDNGVQQKTMSISSIWGDPDHANGYNIVRYNATYFVNGVGVDDLAIIHYAGKGIAMFGGGVPPSGIKLAINGNVWLKQEVQLENALGLADGLGEPSTKAGIAQLFVSTDHKLKLKLGSGTVLTMVTE